MTLDEALGLAIRQTRIQRHLSQEAIGASQSFVSDVERGKKSVTLNRLDAFAQCLKVQPATLLIKAALIAHQNLNSDDVLAKIHAELAEIS